MISTQHIGLAPSDDYAPSGVIIDGVNYRLGGQPPIATSKGWGSMSWLLFPWR